jgi:hypothetical protein
MNANDRLRADRTERKRLRHLREQLAARDAEIAHLRGALVEIASLRYSNAAAASLAQTALSTWKPPELSTD